MQLFFQLVYNCILFFLYMLCCLSVFAWFFVTLSSFFLPLLSSHSLLLYDFLFKILSHLLYVPLFFLALHFLVWTIIPFHLLPYPFVLFLGLFTIFFILPRRVSQYPWWCAQRTHLPPIVLPPSCVNMPVIWAAQLCAESQAGRWKETEPS